MQPITKSELDALLSLGILKQSKGRINGLITGCKGSPARKKARWVEEPLYYKLYPKLDPRNK